MTLLAKTFAALFPDFVARLSLVASILSLRGGELDMALHMIDRIVSHRRAA